MASYATVAQLRIRVQMRKEPTAAQVTMLEEIIEAASTLVDNACGVAAGAFLEASGEVARYFTAYGLDWLRIPGCTSIAEVAVKASLTATTYTAWTSPTTSMAGDGDWIPARGSKDSPTFGEEPFDLLLIDLNGDYAVFFIEFDSIPESPDTATFYMYYGNSEASTGSDITATMDNVNTFENTVEDFTNSYNTPTSYAVSDEQCL